MYFIRACRKGSEADAFTVEFQGADFRCSRAAPRGFDGRRRCRVLDWVIYERKTRVFHQETLKLCINIGPAGTTAQIFGY